MFTKSIRWRLLLWLAFLLVCILSGFGVTAYQLHRVNQFNQIDEVLERRLATLSTDVRGGAPFGPPPGRPPFEPDRMTNGSAFDFGPPRGRPPFEPGRDSTFPQRSGPDSRGRRGWMEDRFETREIHLSPQTSNLFDQTETNGFYFAVWSRGGNLLLRSTNAPAGVPLPEGSAADTRTHTRTREALREAFHFTERGDCVLVGRWVAPDLAATRRLALWLVSAGVAVLALGLAGSWWVATHAMRPIRNISATAVRIAAGDLSQRIDAADTESELGRLAGVLNSTFARLDAAFAHQARFTSDASHELRTPVSVIISQTQTALSRERTGPEYRESLEACQRAAQRMRKLTESLLELARLDAGQEPMKREPFDLSRVARECVEFVRPLAAERGIEIRCELSTVECLGDAERIGQVATNLLTNAIHFNRDGGHILVSTHAGNGAAILAVADKGEGIPAEDLPHVFERFYRVDKSRSRIQGRTGLGLAICKAIVDTHGGSIEVSSQPGTGSTFSINLPLK
jgi:two-component system, OmpR family, sensor kinase